MSTTYTLNERAYTTLHPLSQELCFEPVQPYVFDLTHLGALDVSGDNSASFLQGQLTCDLNHVTPTQMNPGAMCNLQGRLLALFDVVAWQGLHLVMPQDLLHPSQSTLAKAALLSRVTLCINSTMTYLGLYVPSGADTQSLAISLPQASGQTSQGPEYCCYAVHTHLVILMFQNHAQKENFQAQFALSQQRGSLAWHYLELQTRRCMMYPNTRGLFLPHRLDLHTTPYISFNKGCYKGQEIIARTHYRAKLKHGLRLFEIKSSEPIVAGQKLFVQPEQGEVGEIIDYCPIDSERYLVAVSIVFEHPSQVYCAGNTQPTDLLQYLPIL